MTEIMSFLGWKYLKKEAIRKFPEVYLYINLGIALHLEYCFPDSSQSTSKFCGFAI